MFLKKETSVLIHHHNKALAEAFIARVIPHLCKKTNPQQICALLNALQISRLKARDSHFTDFIKRIKTEALDTEALIRQLTGIILENEPFYTLLACIQELHLISDEEIAQAAPTLNLQVQLLYLFEAFSITMMNSKTFNEDIYNFILQLRQSPIPGNPLVNFLFASGYDFSFFKNMKIVAVDPVMTSGAFVRSLDNLDSSQEVDQKAQDFIKRYNLSLWNADIDPCKNGPHNSVKNIALNMIWAICGNGKHNALQKRNAQAGCGLIAAMETLKYQNWKSVKSLILPPETPLNPDKSYPLLEGLKVDDSPKVVSEFYMSKEWMDLYSLWDLLFLMDEFDAIFLPVKLLIPSVLGATPEHYIETRVFSLFLIGNLFHACKTDENPLFANPFKCKQRTRIFEEWSKINDTLVNNLLKKHCPDLKKTSEDIYRQTIGETPSLALVKHLLSFTTEYENFALTGEASDAGFCAIL